MSPKRFFRHGELPLVILSLLERKPMHSYQLLVELQYLFTDDYEPSTGTVYPAVTALKEQGLISSSKGGSPTVYTLTDTGRKVLQERRELLAELELRTGARILANGSIDSALGRFSAKVHSLAGHLDVDTIEDVLRRTEEELTERAKQKEK
jgi:DNA-binding PadR family transcriptional regulator